MQGALDRQGLRYQVLDTDGRIREWLSWPVDLPPSSTWQSLPLGTRSAPLSGTSIPIGRVIVWKFTGTCPSKGEGTPQTLLAGWEPGGALASLWIGLAGAENRVGVSLAPQAGRSPHRWHGPTLEPDRAFSMQIAIHTGMGPGGLLWRWDDDSPWSSLEGASPWGAERLTWPTNWSIGHGLRGMNDEPFRGPDLLVSWQATETSL
jgi:hypothetical protein